MVGQRISQGHWCRKRAAGCHIVISRILVRLRIGKNANLYCDFSSRVESDGVKGNDVKDAQVRRENGGGGREAWSSSGDPSVETDVQRRRLFLVKLRKFDNSIDHATVAYF